MKFSIYVFGPIPTWEGPMRERHGYKYECRKVFADDTAGKEDFMTQEERLLYLIKFLIKENDELKSLDIPTEDTSRKRLLRSLMNVRPPKSATKDFLKV